MSRATTCALIVALQKYSPTTATELARQCLCDTANAREWLYEFEAVGIVARVGTRVGVGKSSGRSKILWAWVPVEKVLK